LGAANLNIATGNQQLACHCSKNVSLLKTIFGQCSALKQAASSQKPAPNHSDHSFVHCIFRYKTDHKL
jgi:hypothetical protein